MRGEAAGYLASVQPVVLVGGRSSRFGRDKLRERLADGGMLVERPIAALREVFGPRVKVVGACHPEVAAAADGVIEDLHPGQGPMGGIVSALAAWGGPVFVLAGDMPGVTAEDVRAVAEAAEGGAWAVLASCGTVHPCFGVYGPGARPTLEALLAEGRGRLTGALPAARVVLVGRPAAACGNVNTPGELGSG